MKTAKQVIKVVWPIIYSKLSQLAEKSDTKIDDHIVQAVNTFVLEWLEDDSDE